MTHCTTCGGATSNQKFCSKSCAAKFNNSKRAKRSVESRAKTSASVNRYNESRPKARGIHEICGEYTKVYLCTCKFTNKKFYAKTPKRIHPSCKKSYEIYAYDCRFTFTFRRYTEWFKDEIHLIDQYGFYHTKFKDKLNINGLSRDHMLSVNYGFKNNIDPKVISHPANCKLMQHRKNSTKNIKCSITTDELMQRIETFNSIYGDPSR